MPPDSCYLQGIAGIWLISRAHFIYHRESAAAQQTECGLLLNQRKLREQFPTGLQCQQQTLHFVSFQPRHSYS